VFYETDRRDTAYNYTAANLFRKYGARWKEIGAQVVMQRLHSWGINTFGNWSDRELYMNSYNRVPYTVPLGIGGPRIDGKNYKFPDVFHPEFVDNVRQSLGRLDPETAKDSFCIGYYIDNELTVKDLTKKLMEQPAGSPSRAAFTGFLKEKYPGLKALNSAWSARYSSWGQVEKLTSFPEGAKEDLEIFDLIILETYYRTCRDEIKRLAPDKIYFGSRLHCHYYPDDLSETRLIALVSEYCDVICFNRYRFSAEDLILPDGIDKPTLIGEFHFGALDRGHFNTGLRTVANQQQRADAYYHYVEGALENPQIVGTHWFQYADQSITGRFDGENYQIGFVNG
jgi:hypothetical protein